MTNLIDAIAAILAASGYTSAARFDEPLEWVFFDGTGFALSPSPDNPDAVRITVRAEYTGQDKYKHWSEADHLANRIADVLEAAGVGFAPEIDGREPSVVLDVFPPTK